VCPVTLPVAEWTALVAALATCFKALITSIAPVGRLIARRDQHLTDEANAQAPAHEGSRTQERLREWNGLEKGAEAAVEAARRGLGSARERLSTRNEKGKRRRLARSPSSEFHLHGSLPSPPTVDEDDSSTRTVTRDALRGRCSCPYQPGN